MAKPTRGKAKPKRSSASSAAATTARRKTAPAPKAKRSTARTTTAAAAATRGARAKASKKEAPTAQKGKAGRQQQQQPRPRGSTRKPQPKGRRRGRPARRQSEEPHTRGGEDAKESEEEEEAQIEAGDEDVEPTQRYQQWFTLPQQAHFLAQAEHELLRACCRHLPSITVCPSSSPAFFTVATHGATPPSSPTTTTTGTSGGDGTDSQGFPPPSVNGAGKASGPSTSLRHSGDGLDLPAEGRQSLGADHEEVYRTVRNTIAASCALGHRSCQAVWGPRGSGKHRLVRLVAQECAKQPNTLVLQLDGSLLNSDEDAIRSIAQQMLQFLLSPQSAALRAADWSIRTGTFDFGVLFRFDRAMAGTTTAATTTPEEGEENWDGHGEDGGPPAAARGGGGGRQWRRRGKRTRTDEETTAEEGGGGDDGNSNSNSNNGEDNEEEDDSPFITTTTGSLVGGAASALPPLQRALLLMKHNHVNLVVCIRQADRFGLWCDQLLYVLAGLMHESDGQGGGMSLLLTSSAPDLRQMEKRLSSRLTGETRFVPLLPWTPRRMLRAILRLVKDMCECRVVYADAAAAVAASEAAGAPRDRKQTASRRRPRSKAGDATGEDEEAERRQRVLATLAPEWQERVAALELLLPLDAVLPFPEGEGGGGGDHHHARKEEESRDLAQELSLQAHPCLLHEVIAAICHDLLQQLSASTNKLRRRQGLTSAAAAATTSAATSPTTHTQTTTLIKRIQELNEDLSSTGATAETVMAAVVNCLCKATAGMLDSLGAKGRHRVMAWLDRRQGQELAWPWTTAPATAAGRAEGSAVGGTSAVPALIQQRWSAIVSGESNAKSASSLLASTSPHLPVVAPSPPDLFDLLEDGKLVQLGYASKECVQVLFHVLVQQESGVRGRSIADLLEDVTSALGTRAAAAVDKAAYRAAVRQLCRWKLLRVSQESETVFLCGSASRLRDFIKTVLEHRVDWCESGVLGLDAREFMRMRSLV